MHSTATISAVPRRRLKWRVVDIIVAAVVGVASGVLFWAWGVAWGPLSAMLAFSPGLAGLLSGGWLFAGILGGLIIRKPGAAVFTELVAGTVEMTIGNQWGFTDFIWGFVEGLGAELAFAILLYSTWRVWVALLSGLGAGLAVGLMDTTFTSYAAMGVTFRLVYIGSAILSGMLAGVLSWYLVKALAATGALSRFAAGRTAHRVGESAGV